MKAVQLAEWSGEPPCQGVIADRAECLILAVYATNGRSSLRRRFLHFGSFCWRMETHYTAKRWLTIAAWRCLREFSVRRRTIRLWAGILVSDEELVPLASYS